MDKKIAIGAAIIMVMAAGGVFADSLQDSSNDTTNSTNITDQNQTDANNMNTTVDGTNNTQGDGTISDNDAETSQTGQSETTQTVTTTTPTYSEDAWKSNPKIRVNPAGHLDKNSPTNRNGTVVNR